MNQWAEFVVSRDRNTRSARMVGVLAAVVACFAIGLTQSAHASIGAVKYLGDGAERVTYRVGPIDVTSGQNRIAYLPMAGGERPDDDGWITRIEPNLVREDGSIPKSSQVMFHHGVWVNVSRTDSTSGGPERFYATGEEKTIVKFPKGYGYRYDSNEFWVLNHMIHNLTPQPMKLYITYTVDFVPDSSPLAAGIKPVRPIWMDVENANAYPVFDVLRGQGGKDGVFTYPADAKNPYPPGVKKNEWTVDRDGVLLQTAGHVHTGGLSTDLYLRRDGARYAGPRCKLKRNLKSKKAKRKARKRYRRCLSKKPSVKGDRVHLFKSKAHYFEPAGPVSWDVAMTNTKPSWRVAVRAGDTLELQTDYETKRASWYESMGIGVAYMSDETNGANPFKKRVDYPGDLNHGHYAENNDHGGKKPVVGPDPTRLPNGIAGGAPQTISGYSYGPGDLRLPGGAGRPPVIEQGSSLTFNMSDGDVSQEIWHSLTSCKSPCNKSTGIAYPIADGDFQFDSGQMGTVEPPTVGRTSWSTPPDLPVGTHTFFCRIHPLMRGAVRVVKKG